MAPRAMGFKDVCFLGGDPHLLAAAGQGGQVTCPTLLLPYPTLPHSTTLPPPGVGAAARRVAGSATLAGYPHKPSRAPQRPLCAFGTCRVCSIMLFHSMTALSCCVWHGLPGWRRCTAWVKRDSAGRGAERSRGWRAAGVLLGHARAPAADQLRGRWPPCGAAHQPAGHAGRAGGLRGRQRRARRGAPPYARRRARVRVARRAETRAGHLASIKAEHGMRGQARSPRGSVLSGANNASDHVRRLPWRRCRPQVWLQHAYLQRPGRPRLGRAAAYALPCVDSWARTQHCGRRGRTRRTARGAVLARGVCVSRASSASLRAQSPSGRPPLSPRPAGARLGHARPRREHAGRAAAGAAGAGGPAGRSGARARACGRGGPPGGRRALAGAGPARLGPTRLSPDVRLVR